jgi:hypothetical protein
MTVAPAAAYAPSPITMRGIIVAPDETVASTGDPGSQVAARCNLDIILNSAGINASEVPDRRSLANLHIWGDHCGTDEQKRDQLAACCQDQFENADEPWHHHVIPNGTLHNIPDDPDKRTCNLGFSKIRQRLGFAAKETLYQGIVETKGRLNTVRSRVTIQSAIRYNGTSR